jgi:hypothetical protein
MRQLIAIPIVHTLAELGSHGEEVRKQYLARYGPQRWRQHLKDVTELWHQITQWVLALPLDFTGVRLYQDGLPRCGRELAIVETLAAQNSKNHQLLLALIHRGAILMGTEDPVLLLQERDRLPKQGMAQVNSSGARPPYDELIARRDADIAQRIASTLQEGKVGLLFIGALHRVTQCLPADIEVHSLLEETVWKGPPASGR